MNPGAGHAAVIGGGTMGAGIAAAAGPGRHPHSS